MKSKLTPLRLARLRKGLGQWEIAKQTGIFQSKISLFENDLIDPTEKEKEKVARALGVSVNEIWGDGSTE